MALALPNELVVFPVRGEHVISNKHSQRAGDGLGCIGRMEG
jgi:hypothetical protein